MSEPITHMDTDNYNSS